MIISLHRDVCRSAIRWKWATLSPGMLYVTCPCSHTFSRACCQLHLLALWFARAITLALFFRYSVKNRNCLVREHRSLNLPFNNYHKDQSTSRQLQRYGKLFWLIRSVKWLWHEYLKLRQQRLFPDYRRFMFSILFFATKAWCSADRFFTNCNVSFQAWSIKYKEIKIWFGSERKHYRENSLCGKYSEDKVKSAKSTKLAVTKFMVKLTDSLRY